MKLTVGLGSIDEYIPYIKAGADEFFCGYVPYDWMKHYGLTTPLNRREVLYYNVQIGSESELTILRHMMEKYHKPVTITLNALAYHPSQYPVLAEYMQDCKKMGFDQFIIADHALLVWLYEQGLSREFTIHVSGELGEVNRISAAECQKLGADRIILHRKVSLSDMKSIITACPGEYEAFLMNEMCHFHGGYCNSLHCDELTHMCLLPYQLGRLDPNVSDLPSLCDPGSESGRGGRLAFQPADDRTAQNLYIPGTSGCGLCALWKLQEAGVSYLKVVSRGGYTSDTLSDIRAARGALELLEAADSEENFREKLRAMIFPNGCSLNCYYPKET